MAIESKKIIEVSTENAVQSVRQLKDEISSLRDAWLNAEEGTEEYDQITQKLIEDQTKLNSVMKVGKDEASAATGSYNALVNEMAALKKVWRETTSEVQRQALGEKIRVINDQLKAFDETIGNNQRKVGSYEQALQVLNRQYDSQKQELSALKTALDNLEPGTEAYNRAFERAAEITHNLKERQEELRRSANDFGQQLSNVSEIGAGLVGSFNIVNSVMILTGNKSEDLQKAMVELQAGIAIVQGLKGIDGLTKGLKGYIGWAAKAYDAIKLSITGRKAEAKQIQATTVAAEANAAANTQVASSEVSAAAGATTLSTGMRTAAAGTSTATVAMTAFKAVLMSLGIGIIIAAISGLITVLSKMASKSKETYKNMATQAKNLIDIETETNRQLELQAQQRWELEKAMGKNEIELAQEKYDYYEKRLKRYTDLIVRANELRDNLETAGAKGNRSKALLSELDKDNFKVLGKNVIQLEKELEKMEQEGNLVFKKMSADAIKAFDEIKEKGVRTWGDIYNVVMWYGEAMAAEKSLYEIDPLGGLKNDIEIEKTTILKDAQDILKTDLRLENERHTQLLNSYKWTNKEREQLITAHNRKVHDIVTAATQSIIDHAKASNQTELENLEDTYKKELKILKQYGVDATQLTEEYEKNKTKLMLKAETQVIEESIKVLNRYASSNGPLAQAYDKMEAAGVSKTVEMAKMLAAKQDEIFHQNQFSLSRQVEYWGDLWEKYGNDEKLKLEERQAIYEKYVNAKMALEKLETQHTLDEIKTRKEALDAEIAQIEKVYDRAVKLQEKRNAQDSNNASFTGEFANSGFWKNLWNGGLDTYNKQREDENSIFGINKERMTEEIEAYKKAAEDMSLTEAERTAAKEKEVLKRQELEELEFEHTQKMVDIEKDEYNQLINTITSVGDSIASVMGSIYDTIEASLKAQVNAGKITEEEMNEQLESYRWIQYTQAVISTAAGALGAFAQASATIPPPYGQIVGAAAAAAVVAQGIAQIAAIQSASKSSSVSNTKMQPATVTAADYEPDYTSNLTGKSDTDYLRNAMENQRLYVSVTDINSVQSRVKTSEEESGF